MSFADGRKNVISDGDYNMIKAALETISTEKTRPAVVNSPAFLLNEQVSTNMSTLKIAIKTHGADAYFTIIECIQATKGDLIGRSTIQQHSRKGDNGPYISLLEILNDLIDSDNGIFRDSVAVNEDCKTLLMLIAAEAAFWEGYSAADMNPATRPVFEQALKVLKTALEQHPQSLNQVVAQKEPFRAGKPVPSGKPGWFHFSCLDTIAYPLTQPRSSIVFSSQVFNMLRKNGAKLAHPTLSHVNTSIGSTLRFFLFIVPMSLVKTLALSLPCLVFEGARNAVGREFLQMSVFLQLHLPRLFSMSAAETEAAIKPPQEESVLPARIDGTSDNTRSDNASSSLMMPSGGPSVTANSNGAAVGSLNTSTESTTENDDHSNSSSPKPL